MKAIIPSTSAQVPSDEVAEVRLLAIVALVVVPLAALALVCISSLAADDGPEQQADVMVGPGFIDSFNVTCATTATKIQASCGQLSYSAFVDDAASASIYFGDSGVTTSAYGDILEAGERIGGNVSSEYCIVASGTQTIHVRALCSSAP